jgi:hypothetical protein
MTVLNDLSRYQQDKHHSIIMSVDLGKQQDYTAFTICEVIPEVSQNRRNQRVVDKVLHVRDIQRLALGTTYDRVAEVIHDLIWDERLWLFNGDTNQKVWPTLLVDCGGVGDAVADDLSRNLGLKFIRYRLVRGTAQTHKAHNNYTVPRTIMFEQLYAAFAGHRISIDPRLKHAKTLLGELENLRPEANEETGYVRVVHREGEHDDLAICIASTNWWANRIRQPLRVVTGDRSPKSTANKLMSS